MKQYLELLEKVMDQGNDREDRTGIGTRSLFGQQIRIDLNETFPLLTTKKMFLRGIIYELLWILRGDTNIKFLADNNVHIWDDWAYSVYKEVKQNFYSQLIQYAKDKGYKDGWSYFKFHERFNIYPHHSLEKVPAPVTQEVRNFITHLAIKKSKQNR